jgi:predicted CopG family antitoxin
MSTKTIAVDSRVYDQLAAVKKEGESFSKAIARLLIAFSRAHTGGQILRGLQSVDSLSEEDSKVFLDIVAENRISDD